MGDNMIPTFRTKGKKYTFFLSDHYDNIENDETEEGTFLNFTNNSVDPFDSHVLKSPKYF